MDRYLVALLLLCINITAAALSLGFIVPEGSCCSQHNLIEFAVSRKEMQSVLPIGSSVEYQPIIINVTHFDNTFSIGQRVCEVLEEKELLAIFNLDTFERDGYLESLAYNLEIPYIKIGRHRGVLKKDVDLTITLYPEVEETVHRVLTDLEVDRVVLVYSGNTAFQSMIRLSKLLMSSNRKSLFQLREVTSFADMHRLLRACKQHMTWTAYVIDLSLPETKDFLNVALMEGMIKLNSSFLLVNMDSHMLDLSGYQYNEATIYTFTLLDESRVNTASIDKMAAYTNKTGKALFENSFNLSVTSILLHDGIKMFIKAMQNVQYGSDMQVSRVSCETEESLDIGHTIYNYLNSVSLNGLSGSVRVEGGKRQDYAVNLMSLEKDRGLQKLSEYKMTNGKLTEKKTSLSTQRDLKDNQTLLVTAIIEEPYLMLANHQPGQTGNNRYVGFCVDLLAEIAVGLGFSYRIQICENCSYGVPDNNGVWGGMTGELINKKADLALGSFTINYQREQVIDLTKPFMNVGISILYKVPNKKTPGLFAFMEPLAVETWVLVGLAYVIVSLTLYFLARASPSEHIRQIVLDEKTGSTQVSRKCRLSLIDSFWFAVGYNVSPIATSTRTVAGFWWLFSLFVVSSYTANLAAFLTVERMVMPIKNAEDLAAQTSIKYGTLINGSTFLFFKESNIDTYKRMWSFMSANPEVFVSSYEEGVERVKKGGYALLMESASIDYKVQRDCDELMQIGGLLDSKGYGIGTQRNSPLRDELSGAILKLQESGTIHSIYDKWWKITDTCGDQVKGDTVAYALDLPHVGGMFLILAIGLLVGLAVAVLEYIHHKKKNNTANRKSRSIPKSSATHSKHRANGVTTSASARKLSDLDSVETKLTGQCNGRFNSHSNPSTIMLSIDVQDELDEQTE